MRTDRVAGSTLTALGLALLGGCTKAEKPAEQAAAAPAAAPAPAPPPTVHVVANDFSFQAPDTVAGGLTTFHLMNSGKELHQVVLLRLAPGQTMADLKKMNLMAPPPPELHLIGGPSPVVPGGTAAATVDLAPGQYVMLCGIPSPDGTPHMAKGMMRALTVTAPTGPIAAPVPDVTITLTDYKFTPSAPLTAGHHLIKVENTGTQWHEMTFVKLQPGKTVQEFAKWGEKLVGPPPGAPINGISSLSVGEVNYIEVDLTPGDYGFLCFLPDVKDHKPHLAHGMIQQFTVK
jgi:uncharacterized cupredoxin-like copper-binding protein